MTPAEVSYFPTCLEKDFMAARLRFCALPPQADVEMS